MEALSPEVRKVEEELLVRRVKFLREAALVERCHTLPHLLPYNVGLHSYNAVNLLLCLHPNPSSNLVRALLWHDCPERFTGDIPYHAKRELLHVARLEWFVNSRFDLAPKLSPEEQTWLSVIDRLELYLWSLEELQLRGNRAFAQYVDTLARWFASQKIPPTVSILLDQYTTERLADEHFFHTPE